MFFVDADVALHPDALRRAVDAFQADPALEACFGSYDDQPASPNFLSQYKNLLHHYVHQHAHGQASTFWTGCGAMRLSTFRALGGFDEQTYRQPSIEDIDLGYRLRRRGGEILLLKQMQCCHLKRWTALSLLRSDVFERGIPWTVLLWRESRARGTSEPLLATGDLLRLPDPALAQKPFLMDLNLQTSNRLSVALTALLLASGLALPLVPAAWPATMLAALFLLALNCSVTVTTTGVPVGTVNFTGSGGGGGAAATEAGADAEGATAGARGAVAGRAKRGLAGIQCRAPGSIRKNLRKDA